MNTTVLPGNKTELQRVVSRLKAGIDSGKYSLSEVQTAVVAKSKRAAAVTDEYVHDNPWQALGIAALVGVGLGVLLARGAEEEEAVVIEPVHEEPKRKIASGALEMFQTAMPLVMFGLKAYGSLRERRRSKAVPF